MRASRRSLGASDVRPYIIPILLRHFVMSLQHQQSLVLHTPSPSTSVSASRSTTTADVPVTAADRGEKGNRCSASRTFSCQPVCAARTQNGRKVGTSEGEQGGANEWTTGLTAAECTAELPPIPILRLVSSRSADTVC